MSSSHADDPPVPRGFRSDPAPAGTLGRPQPDPLAIQVGPREFFARLQETLGRARETTSPLGVMLVEIDGFAAHLGQIPGRTRDAMLERVTRAMRDVLRRGDCFTQLNDGRLAVLLEGAGRGKTRAAGGSLRSRVEALASAETSEWPVTVTIGGACRPADGDTSGELLRRAEEALGEARRLGRNRVWCYVRRPRVSVRTPVYMDALASERLGTTLDLSDSGLFLETGEPIPVGLRLAISLELPGIEPRLPLVARVVRVVRREEDGEQGSWAVGLEFESYGPGSRRLLDTFIGQSLVAGRAYAPDDPDME